MTEEKKTEAETPQITNFLSREEILKQTVLKKAVVFVKEWGGSVIVREMTASEKDNYEGNMIQTKHVGDKTVVSMNYDHAKARMASACCIDEDGKPLFSAKDIQELGKLSAQALNKVTDKIEELSGLSKKDKNELEKN